MKHYKLVSLLLFGMMHPIVSFAMTHTDGDGHVWYFELDGNGDATITICPGIDNLVVPREIEGHKVVAFSASLSWAQAVVGGGLRHYSARSVFFPSSVTNINTFGFRGAVDLMAIEVEAGNSRYETVDGVFYEKDYHTSEYERLRYPNERRLVYCVNGKKELTIAADVTAIGNESRGGYNGKYGAGYSLPYQCEWGGRDLVEINVDPANPCYHSIDGMLCQGEWLCQCPMAYEGDKSIPSTIKELACFAFWNCSKLNNIDVAEDHSEFAAYDGALYSKDYAELLAAPGGRTHLKVHSQTKKIGSLSQSQNLETIELPEGLEEIGTSWMSFAFEGCEKLAKVAIPQTVCAVGEQSFMNCYGLKNVDWGANRILREIPNSAFENCYSLTSITFPVSLHAIGNLSFASCTSLEYVVFSESITNIGERAFNKCNKLSEVRLPSDLQRIGKDAFSTEYRVNWIDEENYVLMPAALKNVIFNEKLKFIGENAFANAQIENLSLVGDGLVVSDGAFASCNRIKTVRLAEGVASLPPRAFSSILSSDMIIEGFEVDSKSPYYKSIDGFLCNADGKKLCIAPYTLETCVIPHGIEILGAGAFSNHRSLAEVIMPSSVTSMENGSYRYVDGEFVAGQGGCFRGCENLSNIVWSASLVNIENDAFNECRSLEFVDMPSSVVKIGSSAFEGCSSLQEVNVSTNLETLGSHAFSECGRLNSILIPSKCAEVGDYVFSGCSNLSSVVVMKGVASLGDEVFSGCVSVTNILIPSSVTEIGANFFLGCRNLVDVAFVGNAPELSGGYFWEFDEDGNMQLKVRPANIFEGTPKDLLVRVRRGSSGWVGSTFGVPSSGLPEAWPVNDDFPRPIIYDDTIVDPDIILENRRKVRVAFIPTGADSGFPPATYYWYIGEVVTMPGPFTMSKAGAVFKGWTDGSDLFAVGDRYELKSGGVCFLPIWGSDSFVLTYNSNGGCGVMTNENWQIGSVVSLCPCQFKNDGQCFLGWATSPSGAVEYVDGQRCIDLCPLSGDEIELFAVWASDANVLVDKDKWVLLPEKFEGSAVWKSDRLTDGQEAKMRTVVSGPGVISFAWRASGEYEVTKKGLVFYDSAKLIIDGTVVMEIAEDKGWECETVTIKDQGAHEIVWVYSKDESGSEGEDCAWVSAISWTPDGSDALFGSIASLKEVFPPDSPVIVNIVDGTTLKAFNEFLQGCGVLNTAELTNGQKEWAYQSFKLEEITTAPQLFEEEPVLKIDDIELSGGNLSLTISLTAGAEAIQLAKDKLADKIRVGTSVDSIDDLPNITTQPTNDGASLTFVIKRPGSNAGFVKVEIE